MGDIFQTSLEMLTSKSDKDIVRSLVAMAKSDLTISSKSDKDIVRSLFAIATSARFTAKLQGISLSFVYSVLDIG